MKRSAVAVFPSLLLALHGNLCFAQAGTVGKYHVPLQPAQQTRVAPARIDWLDLMKRCAPHVAPRILHAIIATESRFDPLALHVNGNVKLRSRPANAAQAAGWAQWLIQRGYSVDMGLMQVNSRNLAALNLTPAGAFDPCKNIRAGAAILTEQYSLAARKVGPGSEALLKALSAYNTGSLHAGFRNGYVAKVVKNASSPSLSSALSLTCVLIPCDRGPVEWAAPRQSAVADTAVRGFGVPQ